MGDNYRKQLMIDSQACLVELLVDKVPRTSPVYLLERELHFGKSEAIILVYDITSRTSFDSIPTRHRQIMQLLDQLPSRRVLFYLVGNKSDEESERTVSMEEGMAAARQLGCAFAEISAKSGTNVELVFGDIVRCLRKLRMQNANPVQERKRARSWSNRFFGSFR